MIPIEDILIIAAIFLAASILASKLSARLGIPVLLLFLLVGMLAGADGPGKIYYDNPWLTQAVGVVALALILFSGGLDTHFDELRPVLRSGLVLATLGIAVTAVAVGLFAHWLLGFTLAEGILLGAIISSTDAAAVLTSLRGSGIYLKFGLKSLLELESGGNDPMAVFLTIGMIELVQHPDTSPLTLVPLFLVEMIVGALLGWLLGKGIVTLINRVRLEYEGLYPVVTLTGVLFTYGLTVALHGNGFLSVYLVGLIMGNSDFIHRNSLRRFHDGMAWLAQIAMFLVLGLQVFPSRLVPIIPQGIAVVLFLILFARPLSVFLALAPDHRLTWRARLFVAWVGLRGAAPIVLATFPLLAGLVRADEIFHLVFFIVLASVTLQGTTLGMVARWLKVDASAPRQPELQADNERLTNDLIEMIVSPGSTAIGKQLLDLHLPPATLLVLIKRGEERLVPNGSTIIHQDDVILAISPQETRELLRTTFESA